MANKKSIYANFIIEMNPPQNNGAIGSTNAQQTTIAISENGQQQQQRGKIGQVERQVENVKVVMSQNVSRILDRGERLDTLDQQSQALQESAQVFTQTSQRVQRAFWLRNMKWTIIFATVLLLLLIIIVLIVLKLVKVI